MPALHIVIVTPCNSVSICGTSSKGQVARGVQTVPEPTPSMTKLRTLLMVGNDLTAAMANSWPQRTRRPVTLGSSGSGFPAKDERTVQIRRATSLLVDSTWGRIDGERRRGGSVFHSNKAGVAAAA